MLKDIVDRQKQILAELEAESKALEARDIVKENAALKAEAAKRNADYQKLAEKSAALSDENARLKDALYGKIFDEKARIVAASEAKLDLYFKETLTEGVNRLTQIERNARSYINGVRRMLAAGSAEAADELTRQAEAKMTQLRENMARLPGAFSKEEREQLAALKAEQITDEQIRAVAQKNNVERFIGLNVLNTLGILLLVIGVITLSRFVYAALPDAAKGILIFILGGGMLAAGEFLNRKKQNVFSLGLSAGGIAVLYVAVAASFFIFHLLGMLPALGVCMLVTAGALILSVRYNSYVIAYFALIGAYLPIFTVSTADADSITKGFMMVYLLLAFTVSTTVPIANTKKRGGRIKTAGVVLLALNTFLYSAIMYFMFYAFGWQLLNGLLAVVFAAVYLALGYAADKIFARGERPLSGMFYLSGMAFVVLAVPLQFGYEWLSLGWLVEGVLLTVYGVLYDRVVFKAAGLAICALCLSAFLLLDWWLGSGFMYKYLAVTLGSLAILGAYIYKKETARMFVRVYKYFALVNYWWFCLYFWLSRNLNGELTVLLCFAFTFALAYAYQRIKAFASAGMQVLSSIMNVTGIGAALLFNMFDRSASLFETLVTLLIGLMSAFALRDMLKTFITRREMAITWYPVILSAYAVVFVTQALVVQYNMGFASAWLSILYAVTALGWIVFGFVRRYSVIRKFGLGLAVLSVVKLFLLDMFRLTQGFRIVSFFALGITLIAISFLYQYFSKRLEIKA